MLDFVLPLIGGHATVNLTPIITALVLACLPVILRWAARNAWAELRPVLLRYLDERTVASVQTRFDRLCDLGIQAATSAAVTRIGTGPITVDAKSAMVAAAVQYVTDNAPATARQVGDVTGKILARFDFHPAVQALAGDTLPIAPPAKG